MIIVIAHLLILRLFTVPSFLINYIASSVVISLKKSIPVIVKENPDIALILLDVVMESSTSGLDVVDAIATVKSDMFNNKPFEDVVIETITIE